MQGVNGSGSATIDAGTLIFDKFFNETVSFTDAGGALVLAKSQIYTKSITGFSTTGGTSLDLRDIGFVSASEATYSGNSKSGVLTVTDGSHSAHIKLIGDYRNAAFMASSDGNGGVTIIDPPATVAHRFVAAAAGLGAGSAGPVSLAREAWRAPPPMLTEPRVMIA